MKLRYMLPRRIEGGEKEERCPESFSFIDPALATGFVIILVLARYGRVYGYAKGREPVSTS